jgi:hypothetical protein
LRTSRRASRVSAAAWCESEGCRVVGLHTRQQLSTCPLSMPADISHCLTCRCFCRQRAATQQAPFSRTRRFKSHRFCHTRASRIE